MSTMKKQNWDAHDYEKHSVAQQKWAQELIGKLDLQGNEYVLDIGCGDGKITAEIARKVPNGRVMGVDSSLEMIQLAQMRYPPQAVANIQFRHMDARHLSFQNEFNIVFSNAALHWVADHQSVLNGISQGLQSNGKALLQMGGQGNAAEMIQAVADITTRPRWANYFSDFAFPFSFYGPEEYQVWLANAGLHPVRIELIPKDMTQDGPTGLAGWLRTTWHPYTHRVPAPRRSAFIDEIVAHYLQRHPLTEDGLTHVKMVRLEIEAVKH